MQHMPQKAEHNTGFGNTLQSSTQDHCRSVSSLSSFCMYSSHTTTRTLHAFRVPNALPGRGSVNVEIFGMAGVPEGAAPGITVPIGTNLYLQVIVLPMVASVIAMLESSR